MPTKKELLKKLEKDDVEQLEEGKDIEKFEETTGKEIDVKEAPGIEIEEKLKKKWKHEETEHELQEEDKFVNEGKETESEEEAGEPPYPEIEKSIQHESDEEEEADKEEDEE